MWSGLALLIQTVCPQLSLFRGAYLISLTWAFSSSVVRQVPEISGGLSKPMPSPGVLGPGQPKPTGINWSPKWQRPSWGHGWCKGIIWEVLDDLLE